MTTEPTLLRITWSVSRGRDTYGYNICRLDDTTTGKRFRCSGGGYDMVGTVVGEWLTKTYSERLDAIASHAYYAFTPSGTEVNKDGLYGMARSGNIVAVDGGCGLSSVERIGQEIGLSFRHIVNRRGNVTEILVTERAA